MCALFVFIMITSAVSYCSCMAGVQERECLQITVKGKVYRFKASIIPKVIEEFIPGDYLELPEGPNSIETDVSRKCVKWTMHDWRDVTYFLVKVTRSTRTDVLEKQTEYGLITVNSSLPRRVEVEYLCLDIDSLTKNVQTDLWTLGNDMVWNPNTKVLTASFGKYSHVKDNVVDIERKIELLNAEDCICTTSYSIDLHRYDSMDSMVAEIRRNSSNVASTTIRIKVELLGSMGDWSVKEEDDLKFKPGEVHLDVTFKALVPMDYKVRIIPQCKTDIPHTCKQPDAHPVISANTFTVKPTPTREKIQKLKEEPTMELNVIALMVFGGILAMMLCLITLLVYLVKTRHEARRHKVQDSAGDKRDTAITEQDNADNQRDAAILEQYNASNTAIIFYPDTVTHKKRVLKLKEYLDKTSGVQAEVFGDIDRAGMRRNWVDYAEEVVRHFSTIIVVHSPILESKCVHTKGTDGETTVVSTVDETLEDKNEGGENTEQTQKLLTNLLTHNFPAVVINSLKTWNAWGKNRHPRTVLLVKFNVGGGTEKAEISQLQLDHSTVFTTRMIQLRIDEEFRIYNYQQLKAALPSNMKRERCCIL